MRYSGMNGIDKDYHDRFDDIPDDHDGRIKYICGTKPMSDKYKHDVEITAKRLKRIKYDSIKFTMWKIVRPSARPRLSRTGAFTRIYVPRAAEDGRWFEKFAEENKLPFVDTPCILNIDIYEKTPSSFTKKDKLLAEMGLLRPWKRSGDFDNYAKGIADAMQHGMLKDDYLVIESTQRLFYSIKPRADVELKYMRKFPQS